MELSILIVRLSTLFLISLVFAGCQGEQSVFKTQEIELVVPFDIVESGYVGEISILNGEIVDPQTESGFESIQQFECAAVAYAKLGRPVLQGKSLPKNTFQLEDVYENPAIPIHQYVLWTNGDRIYCLAFNELGEVVAKSSGSSSK